MVPPSPAAIGNSVFMEQVATDRFFAYVKRRRDFMAVGGIAAVAVGVIGIVVLGGGAGAASLGVLVLLGLLLVGGAGAGASTLREGRQLLAGSPVRMDLSTWPYRTIRSPMVNRVLVTLDVPGSTNRTPLAEFKPVWYTPGSVNGPTRTADVFGRIERGQPVLAVAEDGSCYLGRVSRVRADR